jgi:DNA-binding GntR family transcriptional regulator
MVSKGERVPTGFGTSSDEGPQSVVDQVASSILSLILSNELEPGEPIAIQKLSIRLGASHVPIREALRRLEGKGLVEFRRGRRPRIAPIDQRDFDSIFALREVVERDVARRSSAMMTPSILSQAESVLSDFQRILTHGNALEVYLAHSRFHLLLLPAASVWDRRIMEQLWTASERYIQMYVGYDLNKRRDSIIELHRDLLNEAVEGDSEGLETATVEHIRRSHTIMASSVAKAAEETTD